MKFLIQSMAVMVLMAVTTIQAQAQISETSEKAAKMKMEAANREAAQQEATVTGQLRWIQDQTNMAQKNLERQLKQAEALRAEGLKKEDTAMLKRAHDLETAAFATYERKIADLEKVQIRSSQPNNRSSSRSRQSSSRSRSQSRNNSSQLEPTTWPRNFSR